MSASSLPLYAIIELIIRISEFNAAVGEYKDHAKQTNGYMVKTTRGTIVFSNEIISKQFLSPESIDKVTLVELAKSFNAV